MEPLPPFADEEDRLPLLADVAQMLDCAVGTVKSRCSRGRARLAELLGVLAPPATGEPPHVDTGNPTPAVAVYESVGMRADIVNDIWRKVIPADC